MTVRGGEHLRVMRSWIQRRALNGERVTWGSSEALQLRALTVADLEQLAQAIADAACSERDELLATKERHLATIARLSRESVTPEEAEELRGQVASLTAALGTERAARQEAERKAESWRQFAHRSAQTRDDEHAETMASLSDVIAAVEDALPRERAAHAKTREVLREVLSQLRADHLTRMPETCSGCRAIAAAEQHLKETS